MGVDPTDYMVLDPKTWSIIYDVSEVRASDQGSGSPLMGGQVVTRGYRWRRLWRPIFFGTDNSHPKISPDVANQEDLDKAMDINNKFSVNHGSQAKYRGGFPRVPA